MKDEVWTQLAVVSCMILFATVVNGFFVMHERTETYARVSSAR
jgi:hypothetical protein